MSDPIADMLTRIRNAQLAKHNEVSIPYSKLKLEIARILDEESYVKSHKHIDEGAQGTVQVELKYDNNEPAINSLDRISVPGRRKYRSSDELPRVKNGYGIAIISSSQGVMTDDQAREEGVGGEVVCSIY
jgi:small subunit ribosomal protein S8